MCSASWVLGPKAGLGNFQPRRYSARYGRTKNAPKYTTHTNTENNTTFLSWDGILGINAASMSSSGSDRERVPVFFFTSPWDRRPRLPFVRRSGVLQSICSILRRLKTKWRINCPGVGAAAHGEQTRQTQPVRVPSSKVLYYSTE